MYGSGLRAFKVNTNRHSNTNTKIIRHSNTKTYIHTHSNTDMNTKINSSKSLGYVQMSPNINISTTHYSTLQEQQKLVQREFVFFLSKHGVGFREWGRK